MNTSVLTAAQSEFAGIFKRLEREFKMSKAAVARALLIERSYVSMLIGGQRTPGIRTLKSMRELEKRMLAGLEPAAAPGEEDSELSGVIKQLKAFAQTERLKFDAVKQVVDLLSQRTTISSKPVTAASKPVKKAAASVRKPVTK